jgi:hypothetical protein
VKGKSLSKFAISGWTRLAPVCCYCKEAGKHFFVGDRNNSEVFEVGFLASPIFHEY